MNNKVLLIQPKNTLSLNIYPPLGLIQIGSVLEANGYDVDIICCGTTTNYKEIILEKCKDALFAGISILTPEIPDAVDIARSIKEHNNIPIVWGGWHVTLFSEEMAESDLVDKIVVDEGDEAILKIADEYKENGYTKDKKNKIINNILKLDMNNLPIPNYSLVPNIETYITGELSDKFLEYDDREIRWLPYQASRGCPYECTFCINVVTDNRKYRIKNAEKVVNEIEHLVKTFNLNHVKIIDDLLFVNINWVCEIAQGIIDRGLDITWDSEVRVDMFNDRLVNDEKLALFVKSGMNEVNFGIESGSEKTLAYVKKNITPEMALHAVNKCSEFGITSRCSFIIDFPCEEKEDIFKTNKLVNKIREIPNTTVGMHTYRPYPGSEICDDMLEQGLISQPSRFEDWSKEEFISDFTYASAQRKWQKNYKLSSKISYYQNLESGFWLIDHQISNKWVKKINNIFIHISRWRNQNEIYGFTIDRKLYDLFLRSWRKIREISMARYPKSTTDSRQSKIGSATLDAMAEGDLEY